MKSQCQRQLGPLRPSLQHEPHPDPRVHRQRDRLPRVLPHPPRRHLLPVLRHVLCHAHLHRHPRRPLLRARRVAPRARLQVRGARYPPQAHAPLQGGPRVVVPLHLRLQLRLWHGRLAGLGDASAVVGLHRVHPHRRRALYSHRHGPGHYEPADGPQRHHRDDLWIHVRLASRSRERGSPLFCDRC